MIKKIIILSFITLSFMSCNSKRVFFHSPAWEKATHISPRRVKMLSLYNGKSLSVHRENYWEKGLEYLLKNNNEDYTYYVTPFWHNILIDNVLKLKAHYILLNYSIPSLEKSIAVMTDREEAYNLAGKIVAEYQGKRPERTRVVGLFYRGFTYDHYASSFKKGFEENSPNSSSILEIQRFYSAEREQLVNTLNKIEMKDTIIILALASMNLESILYLETKNFDNLLFVTSNNAYSGYREDKMLFSIENNYKKILQQAFAISAKEKKKEFLIPALFFFPSLDKVPDIKSIPRERLYKRKDREDLPTFIQKSKEPPKQEETRKDKPENPFPSK